MRQFFSQTWVVAGLIVVVLGVACYIAYKVTKEDDKVEEGKEDNK